MSLATLGVTIGLGGVLLAKAMGTTAVLPDTDDTCTPAVVCQASQVINGSWTVAGGGTYEHGKCRCSSDDPPTCLTKHCSINLNVTCTGGGSYRVTGTGPCTDGQPSKNLVVRNCGGADAAMFMIYQGPGCNGTSVWHTYHVTCGAGDCGSYTCPTQ
jgi:hypothetical protein